MIFFCTPLSEATIVVTNSNNPKLSLYCHELNNLKISSYIIDSILSLFHFNLLFFKTLRINL